jgi:serine/threonine protein kinase
MAFSLKDLADIKKIAEGGMGNVFVATQVSLGRKVVIKELSLNAHKDAKLIKRFENEARSAAALDHENIIQVFDFGADNGSFYISMEYLDGWDLEKIMHWDPFPKEIGIMILVKALKGLEYAHQRGTVHCDVKPGNILVSKTGKVKVVDFGLAHAGSKPADFMESSSVYVTPGYMAPEIASGGENQGSSQDIWSAGVVAYKIIGGLLPFAADTVRTMVYSIVNEKEKDIQELCPTLPDDCADAIRACLQKNPKKRPSSLEGMINAFGNYLYDLGVHDSDRVIVNYVQDKTSAAAELAGLCAAYHLRKGSDYLDSGNSRKSDIHFREAERFGAIDLDAGHWKQGVNLKASAAGKAALRKTKTAGSLGGKTAKIRIARAAAALVGILGVFILGATSVSMVFRTDHSDPAAAGAVPGGVAVGKSEALRLQKDLPAETKVMDTLPGYAALSNELTSVNEYSRENHESPDIHAKGTAFMRNAATGARNSMYKQQENQPGILKLSVDPPEAQVSMDGEALTAGEVASGKRVKPGRHTLAASAKGYKSYTGIITIEASAFNNVGITLKPGEKSTGFLHVYSYPWSDVYVDGTDEGTAPMANPLMLSEGDHAVVLKREGYKPFTGTVHITEGVVARLKVQLEQETHTAAINQASGSE